MSTSSAAACAQRAEENPFGSCLYFTANAVARHVSRLADEAFASTGLNPSTGLLLSLVVGEPGIPPSRAAELLHLAPSSVTRFADALVRRAYVRREQRGRQILLFPTPEGEAALAGVEEAWAQLYESYSRDVGKRRGETLARELSLTAELLAQSRPG